MKFQIYYADSSISTTLSSGYGVVCILQNKEILQGTPYYIFSKSEGGWLPAKFNDIIDFLVNKPGDILHCCVGQIVGQKRFLEIYRRAQADREKKMD